MTVVPPEENTPLLLSSSPIPSLVSSKKATIWHILIPTFIAGFCAAGLAAPSAEIYTIIFCTRYFQRLGEFSVIPLEKCAIPEIQQTVAWVEGISFVLVYGSGLFVASFYGALSDRKGRVLVSKITMIGFMFLYACFILMSWYPITNFSVFLIFFGPLVHGLLAGGSVMLANIQAYISDCTLPTERTLAFSYLLATIYLGGTLGPICASFLIKATGMVESIFYASFVIYFLMFLYSAYVLPESVEFSIINNAATTSQVDTETNTTTPVHAKTEAKEENTNKLMEKFNFLLSLKIFKEARISTLVWYAGIVLGFIQLLSQTAALPPIILYGMLRFNWTSVEGGIYISVTSVAKMIALVVILPLITKRFDTSNVSFDIWMIRIGIISDVVRFLCYGLAANTLQFTIAGSLECFALFSQPSIRTLLISMVKPTQVGELMGALAVIDGLAVLISQLGMKGIYSATVAIMPNFIFFLCAFVSAICLLLSLSIRKLINRGTDPNV